MNIYIFERIENVSGNYHKEGGLVIIASSIEHAKEVISVDKNICPTDEEWDAVQFFHLKDREEKPRYWVMPDAGCC
jgi:hypothetical protein